MINKPGRLKLFNYKNYYVSFRAFKRLSVPNQNYLFPYSELILYDLTKNNLKYNTM